MKCRNFPNAAPYGTSLDLTAIRIFVAIADTGSFVAAGKSMGLTRSAAGKALTRLEEYLETRLFQRTTRQVTLTAEGQEFYERCVQILNILEVAESSLRSQPTQLKGILRITVSEGYGKTVILPLIYKFQQQFPELSFDISFTDRIVDLVEEGVDLAIRVGDSYTSTQYISRAIDRSRLGLYASPGYLEKNDAPTNLADLSAHQLLIYGSSATPNYFQLNCKNNHIVKSQGKSFLKFDSGDAIRIACCTDMGISLLPEFLVENDVNAGRLIPLYLDDLQLGEIKVHSIYPNRQFLSNRVRIFLDTLKDYLERD
ncbi:LysR family transcriptional regulator [Oceanospirillum sp.]|uniref:LysR family transcriptional regulator n=1 Tax=Oceanospirillum sp. TaxID=2021254 RepID=UPI003A909554